MATTIFERLENKIDRLGNKVKKEAEKEVMKKRISEIGRGKSFWEKVELTIKLWA